MKDTTAFERVDIYAKSDDIMATDMSNLWSRTVAPHIQRARQTVLVSQDEEQVQATRELTSTDPNDPQNWAPWHKHLTYGTICLFSFMANVNASAFTVAVRPLSLYFHISATLATAMTALNVLMFGVGNILWVPLMRVIGKRPVYLIAIAILIASNAWSAKASSWGSLLAARMVSGLGASAADATVPSVVGDLYHHEDRGSKLMFFHLALASGIFLGPLINAWVIQLHGWRWVPGWMAIVFGFIFALGVVCIHETEYRRLQPPHVNTIHGTNLEAGQMPVPTDSTITDATTTQTPRRPFLSRLSLSHGLQRRQPFKAFSTCLWDILVMLSYPIILWPSILIGSFVGWTIIIQITVGQTFTLPPYSWSIGEVGLFHLAGFIGVLLAIPFGGVVVDYLARRAVRGEEGKKANPRERLVALLVPALIAPPGLLIYGILLSHHKSWIGPAFGYLMHSFGFAAVSNIVVVFAIDAYQTSSAEGFVSLFVIRNVVAVICSFYEAKWMQKQGMERAFGTMAGIEWGFLLLGGLVWLYTPKLIAISARYGPERRRRESLKENGVEMGRVGGTATEEEAREGRQVRFDESREE